MIEFLLAVLLLELTPGPNMAYLAALTLAQGRRAGLIVVGGVAAGLSVHALLAAYGVGALIAASPAAYELLRWAGVMFLLYLAWDGWRGADGGGNAVTHPPADAARLFRDGFVTNVLNPKSVLFFVSVLPGFLGRLPISGGQATGEILALGAIYVAIATAVHAGVVALAARLRPFLVSGRNVVRVRRLLSIALAMVAVWLIGATAR